MMKNVCGQNAGKIAFLFFVGMLHVSSIIPACAKTVVEEMSC